MEPSISPRVLLALTQWQLILVFAAFLLNAVLILLLFNTKARKRQVEIECERLKSLAECENKRLNDLITNVPGIVWETKIDPISHQHVTTFVSQQAETMLGYTPEEWISTPDFCLRLIHDADRERVERELQDILSQKKQGILQFRWIAKGDHPVWVKAQVAPVIDEAGTIIGSRGITVDVTEQHLAETARLWTVENNLTILEALGRNEAQLAAIIDSSEQRFAKVFRANPQPMSLTTVATGRYIDVNESFLAMSGYTRDEVIGHTSLELRI